MTVFGSQISKWIDCVCNETNLGLEEAQNDGLDEGGNAAIKVDEANAVAPAKDII